MRPSSRPALMGDSIATNLFMVGYAYQRGLHSGVRGRDPARRSSSTARRSSPTSARSSWGRLAARRSGEGRSDAATPRDAKPESQRLSESLDEIDRAPRRVPHRLPGRGVRASATRTSSARCGEAEARAMPGSTALTEAVARYYFKLLAIKDEYEVARLYTETDFVERVAAQFEGDYTLKFHLAPPLFDKPDPVTGEPSKSAYGPWMLKAFRRAREDAQGLAAPRSTSSARPRSAAWSAQLIGEYEALVDEILGKLAPHNHALAVELARSPSTSAATAT